jgi:hypothetical protein
MRTTLSLALAALLVLTCGSAIAGSNPPLPSGSNVPDKQFTPPVAGDAIGDVFGITRTFVLCDQYAITYTLDFSGGSVSGTAVGANSCGVGGTWPVSGSYGAGGHVTLTVTNPSACDLQFYVIEGQASRSCRCIDGTYDWNGDGADGPITLTRCR